MHFAAPAAPAAPSFRADDDEGDGGGEADGEDDDDDDEAAAAVAAAVAEAEAEVEESWWYITSTSDFHAFPAAGQRYTLILIVNRRQGTGDHLKHYLKCPNL